MTFTRLSDDFFDRPTILDLSRSARLLHIEALVYCNTVLSDGAINRNALRRVTDSASVEADLDELVLTGLWVETGKGWQIDWTDQRDADDVLQERAANATRQKEWRDRKRLHDAGDHSICLGTCRARNASPNGKRDASVTPLVTGPSPSQSLPPLGGKGRGSAGARPSAAPATPPQMFLPPNPTVRVATTHAGERQEPESA